MLALSVTTIIELTHRKQYQIKQQLAREGQGIV